MLLFVAADRMEFAGLAARCSGVSPAAIPVDWARTGHLHDEPILMLANGAGASRAAAAVDAAAHDVRAVISTGFCGALDPALRIGDIFVTTALGAAPVDAPESDRPHARGVLASIDRVAQSAAEKRSLRAQGAAAVEMEAAGIHQRAQVYRLPFYCVRSVTDLAEESFANDLNAALRPDGHFATMQILRSAMCRPFIRIPELLRLHRRCGIAARALGDFLADCRF